MYIWPHALDHEHEVRQRGRVGRAARRGAEDDRDLRDDAGRSHVAVEDGTVAGEAVHALLYARAARVDEAHHGRAGGHCQVHHFAHLLRHSLGERAAEYGEVLRIDEHQPPVYLAVAGDDGVSEVLLVFQPELGSPVQHEGVQFLERAFVEKHGDAFARGEFAAPVLAFDTSLAAALQRLFPFLAKFVSLLVNDAANNHVGIWSPSAEVYG